MENRGILSPNEAEKSAELLKRIGEELNKILLGHEELHRMVLIGILCRGHILLEGLPGVGKTMLVKALGQLMDLSFKRVQFTPDLLPGDILGSNILQETPEGHREMVFQPGPVFTNILLADEINRASPKTQAALLEAMQEAAVTLFGETRELPRPFFVLASQNPIEMEGTYPIPEAQLDRFLFKLHVYGVGGDSLTRIITERRRGEPPLPESVFSPGDVESLFEAMGKVALPRAVAQYISNLVILSTPNHPNSPEFVHNYVSYGASPRAAIAMAEAARAAALMDGRPAAGFDDVNMIAPAVLNHRLILNYKARLDRVTGLDAAKALLDAVDEAGMNLPADISISVETEDQR
jgi:MoxR-like ATPase